MSKCPPNPLGESFFLHSLNRPTNERWYSNRVVGYNLLSTTVKRLCSAAGIIGKKTNHSLRATRLFRDGVDKQLIMNVTGHRNVEGIRTYKRTSPDQFKDVSKVLHCTDHEQENKAPKTTEPVKMNPSDFPGLCFNGCNNISIDIKYSCN